MPAYWNSASKQILSYFLLTFFLLGCKTTTPIDNGATITDLAGKAGESKMFSVTLPDSMDGLLVQAAGSDTVTIDLMDENEISLGSCVSERVCLIDHPASTKYLIKLTSGADYSNVSVSATWGGEAESVLVNNAEEVGISAKQGNVLLKSMYLENAEPLVQVTASGVSGTVGILDRFGDVQAHCDADSVCRLGALSQGLYYIRVLANADFTDATLNAQWGAATGVTLENGVPQEISGNTGDMVTNTLFLPEGADSLMVYNYFGLTVEILDQDDAVLQRCSGLECRVDGLNQGLYRVRVEIRNDDFTAHVTAAWGGPGVSLIENGGTVMRSSVPARASVLVPVYLPEGLTSGMAQAGSPDFDIEVFEPVGPGEYCGNESCAFDADVSGVYFIRAVHYGSAPLDMKISAVWGGENAQTLINGERQQDLSLQSGEVQLESLYVPENVFGFALVVNAPEPLEATVIGPELHQRLECSSYSPCFFQGSSDDPLPQGGYLISIRNNEAVQQDYDLAVKWGGAGHPSLSNGVNGAETELQPGDFIVDVIVAPGSGNVLAAMGSGDQRLNTSVYGLSGSRITDCDSNEACVFELESRLYYVVAVNGSTSPVTASLVATWANDSVSTLQSDMPAKWLTLEPGASNLQSVFVPYNFIDVDWDVLLGMTSYGSQLSAEVYRSDGRSLASCSRDQSCGFSAVLLRRNEVMVKFTNESDTKAVTFNPVVSFSSPDYATFNNGEFKRDIVLEPNELRIESIYSPLELGYLYEGGFAISGMAQYIQVGLHTAHSGSFSWPYGTMGDLLPDAGAQFISFYNYGTETEVFSLSAAWATSTEGSLLRGATFSDLSGQQGDMMLQTFVPAENATATVTTSNPDVVVSLGASVDDEYIRCQSVCTVDVTAGWAYFFKARFIDSAENVTVTVTW